MVVHSPKILANEEKTSKTCLKIEKKKKRRTKSKGGYEKEVRLLALEIVFGSVRRNLRDCGTELLKIGILKMNTDSGIARSIPKSRCARSWKVAK